MALLLKYHVGSGNEASSSAQPWDLTNVWGDVVDHEHDENGREYREGGEGPRNASDMQRTTAGAGDCS